MAKITAGIKSAAKKLNEELVEGLAGSASRQIKGPAPEKISVEQGETPKEGPEKSDVTGLPIPSQQVISELSLKADELTKIKLKQKREELEKIRMPEKVAQQKTVELVIPKGKTRGSWQDAVDKSKTTGERRPGSE